MDLTIVLEKVYQKLVQEIAKANVENRIDEVLKKYGLQDEVEDPYYDIANSKLNRDGVKTETCECEETPAPIMADGTYLFTTATCPNCKIACSLLDKAGISYEKLLANEYANEASALGIKQAPTLVVIKNGVAEKFAGVSDIKKAFNI